MAYRLSKWRWKGIALAWLLLTVVISARDRVDSAARSQLADRTGFEEKASSVLGRVDWSTAESTMAVAADEKVFSHTPGSQKTAGKSLPLKVIAEQMGTYLLQTPHFSLTLDPAAGGAITLIRVHEEHPDLKTDWQADRVFHGKLLVEFVTVDGKFCDLSSLPFEVVSREPGEKGLILQMRGDATSKVPGLFIEKSITIVPDASAFEIHETFRNVGDRTLKACLGSLISIEPERWAAHSNARMWAGAANKLAEFISYNRGPDFPSKLVRITEGTAWLTSMNTYGKAFAVRYLEAPNPLALEVGAPSKQILPEDSALSTLASVRSDELMLESGKSMMFKARILVGQSLTGFEKITDNELFVGADFPDFRPPKIRFSLYAAAMSPQSKQVEVLFRRRLAAFSTWEILGHQRLRLAPGVTAYVRHSAEFLRPGSYIVSAVFSEGRKQLATVERPIFIGDMDAAPAELSAVTARWNLRMPEYRVSGSWSEIGETLARVGRSGFTAAALEAAKQKWLGSDPALKERVKSAILFHRANMPWYLEFLGGVAKQLGLPLGQLLTAEILLPREEKKGCVNIGILKGPDGPLAAWSNEDGSLPEKRCYYLLVRPRDGYAFHSMDGYGVNEKGLAITGANLGEHPIHTEKGKKMVDDWLSAGNFTVPIGSGARGNISWILAKCATVQEAVQFLTHPVMRVSFQGNMLIMDRQGDAAIFQSTGLINLIRRPSSNLLTCTNYPAARTKEGDFEYGLEHVYFNGVLREKAIGYFLSLLPGKPAIKDVLELLTCRQEPGTICQNPFENSAQYITATSFLAQCKTGDLYLCWGNPWYTRFERYCLNQ